MSADKENVFRTLREEELLVNNFWCRFGWHKWTKYREPSSSRGEYGYMYTTQERRCGSCNMSDKLILEKM